MRYLFIILILCSFAIADEFSSDLTPETTNFLDIGTLSLQFKDAYGDGTLDWDTLTDGTFSITAGVGTGFVSISSTTFTDGTTSISGGNFTGVGNITGTDVDISAGTGDYTSTGTIGIGSITISGLTSGRVPIISTGGLLADDADFTFATDTLTVTKVNTTELTLNLTHDYVFGEDTFGVPLLAIQNQSQNTATRLGLYTNPSDPCAKNINVTMDTYGFGTPDNVNNYEKLSMGWFQADNTYAIRIIELGTGIIQPFEIGNKDHEGIFVLNADGSITTSESQFDFQDMVFMRSGSKMSDATANGSGGSTTFFFENTQASGATEFIDLDFKQGGFLRGRIRSKRTGAWASPPTRNAFLQFFTGASIGVSTGRALQLMEDQDAEFFEDVSLLDNRLLTFGTTITDLQLSSDGTNGVLAADTSINFKIGGSSDMQLNANSLDMQGSVITDLSGLHFNSATELTISSGAVTATQGHHSIDTEDDATNDDLDTINGGNPGEILLILPADDTRTVRIRHDVGNIFLKHQVESKGYSFSSPAGSSGTFYSGGYYNWTSTNANLDQGSLSVTHSAANSPSACHIGIVAGGEGAVDTGVVKITVAGTTIDDEGNRLASQTVDLVADINSLSLDQYVETTEKWIGQVTIALVIASGSPVNFNLDINYGCSKYEDFGNQAFTVTVVEVVGLAGANDTGFNLRLFHHSTAGWTYAASGFVPGGTVLANMNTDYSTEQDLVNGESFAYKRVNLNTDIAGDESEGLVLEITTSANKAVEIMDLHLGVHTAPNFAYLATNKQHLIFMKHGPNWLEL